jgi:recombination protein RecA
MMLGAQPKVDVNAIPTGSIGVDWALGIGGLPRGRIIEVFGPESSGKTTLSLHAIAEAQKKGGVCAFIDAEHALDPEYAKKARRKNRRASRLAAGYRRAGARNRRIARAKRQDRHHRHRLRRRAHAQRRNRGRHGPEHVGKQARLMSQALRKLTAIVSKTKTVVIFINQIRMQIGVMFGNPETTPGGKALKFYTSVRIDIRRIAQIKKGDETVGGRHRVKIVKNKVAAPFRQTEFDMLYGEGISREGEALALGEKFGLVQKSSGGSYAIGEAKLGRGYDAARTFLKENKPVLNQLLKDIRKNLQDGGTPAPKASGDTSDE